MDPSQSNEQMTTRCRGRVPARPSLFRLAGRGRVLGTAVVLLAALTGVSSAADDQAVRQWVAPRLDAWVEVYEQLHAHPELSLLEQASAAFIAQRLGAAGIT